jgi:hypothetical protein
MKDGLKMHPVKPHWWMLAMPWLVIIIICDERQQYLLWHFPGSFFKRETYV